MIDMGASSSKEPPQGRFRNGQPAEEAGQELNPFLKATGNNSFFYVKKVSLVLTYKLPNIKYYRRGKL